MLKSILASIVAGTLMMTPTNLVSQSIEDSTRTIPILFENGGMSLEWNRVNDTVMGGVSSSSFNLTEENRFIFNGNLSLENNGGFASVRSSPAELGLDNLEFFQLRVLGDGRSYQLRLRTDNRWDGVAYKQDFQTIAGQSVDLFLPVKDFEPTWRGRYVSSAPPLNPADIRQIGFMLADKNPGDFQLEVEFVRGILKDTSDNSQNVELSDSEQMSVRDILARAVSVGAPLYNQGNHAACAAAYEMTIYTLAHSHEQMNNKARKRLMKALSEAQHQNSSDKAWTYRHAMDELMRMDSLEKSSKQVSMK